MIQKFEEANYEIVDFEDNADVYVINTCTVTNMSDKKSRQIINRVKEHNPNSILIVTGCYAQIAKQELKKIHAIDIVLGVEEKKDIVQYVEKFEKEKLVNISIIEDKEDYTEYGLITHTEKTRAVIKIQDGCNMFCSYCIIPYARGRIRSRKPENIISEIAKIVESGIKEVVLAGIHIASYGKDFEEEYGLIDLLEEINEIEDLKRIRLGSLEPTIITQEFINRLEKLEKICHHFHLSLQSACDETLKRMNRKYNMNKFNNCVQLLRQAYKDVILTTDIIVGFPGETDEEFDITYNELKKINFYKMHVFKYSKRNGTIAAKMKNQVDGNKQEQRSNMLLELSDTNTINKNKEYIGKVVEVLFEEEEGKYIKGHTANYLVVAVENNDLNFKNEIKQVKIHKISNEILYGKINFEA